MPATIPPLERARAKERAMQGMLQMLVLLVATLVEFGGMTAHPRPGTAGAHLVVLIALVGFASGVVGVSLSHEARGRSAVFLVIIIACSAMLVGFQPKGPATLGAFLAVAIAAMRVRGHWGAAIALLAMLALPVAGILGNESSLQAIALNDTGVLAFYTVALLANRLREGQQEAEQLVRELEHNRDAQARAAVLAERQRLAREMHDVLAHSLSGLALELEGARLLAESKGADAEIVEKLARAHHLVRSGLDEARRAIGLLRDAELPGPERLPQLLRQWEHDAAIAASIRVTGTQRDLAPDARLTLYRAAQEALTNVRKHARCTRVEMRLDYEPRGTRLSVEDFGAVPSGARASLAGGFGLTGMRERAELLGGSLTARATDAGFLVELWVPS
jgi:signal transduction histidine kinase